MRLEEQQITLRKLIAANNRLIISKEVDENGNPLIEAKEIYLGVNDDKSNYKEVVEETYLQNKTLKNNTNTEITAIK